MLKPFPLPITVGTDICNVKRIYDILSTGRYSLAGKGVKGKGGKVRFRPKRFVHKVLNGQEISDAIQRGRLNFTTLENGPANAEDQERMRAMASFLGGRFAAKEAIMKAHSKLHLTFHEITVLGGKHEKEDKTAAPTAIINALKDGLGSGSEEGQVVPISISHDGEYATAVALGFNVPQALSHVMSADGATPWTPAPPTAKPELNDSGVNPLEQPPAPKESLKLGIYTVLVDHLRPEIEKPLLLDVFRQEFSSVRWVTVNKQIYEENGKEYRSGFVTFGFRADADRAIREFNGLIVMGQSIKVTKAIRNMKGKREKDGGVWLFNEDVEGGPPPESQDPRNEIEYKPPPLLESVFQDEPIMYPTNHANRESTSTERLDDLSTWNTEETIQTSSWYSIEGDPIDPSEMAEVMRKVSLRDVVRRNEQKKEEEKRLVQEMRKYRNRQRGPLKIKYHAALPSVLRHTRRNGVEVQFRVAEGRKGFIVKP